GAAPGSLGFRATFAKRISKPGGWCRYCPNGASRPCLSPSCSPAGGSLRPPCAPSWISCARSSPWRPGISEGLLATALTDQRSVQGLVIHHLACLVHSAHGIGRDLVDDHYLPLHKSEFDLHVDQGKALLPQLGLDEATGAAGELLSLFEVKRLEESERQDGVVVDEGIASLIVLDGDLDEVAELALGIANIALVATQETAPGPGAADESEAASALDILAQRLGATHLHAALLEVGAHEVGGDPRGLEALEEMLGHGQRLPALALDLADDAIGARIDDTPLSGDVVLEDEKDVAVGQGIDILGLARIDPFTAAHRFTCWQFRYP